MRFTKTRCGSPELIISDDSNWSVFERLSDAICVEFGARVVEKIDGLDERYWDLKMTDGMVTLHLQYCLGISLYAQTTDGEVLVRKIGDFLGRRSCEPRYPS